jgi:hypothetical protein
MGVTTDGFCPINLARKQVHCFARIQTLTYATFPASHTALKYEQFNSLFAPFHRPSARREYAKSPNGTGSNGFVRKRQSAFSEKTSAQAMADANAQMNGGL